MKAIYIAYQKELQILGYWQSKPKTWDFNKEYVKVQNCNGIYFNMERKSWDF